MNNLNIFEFENKTVRTVTDQDGNVWFPIVDILKTLNSTTKVIDIKNSIIQGLGDEEVINLPIKDDVNREQDTILTSENGLIFVISRSKTDTGKKLNRFIHKEVLPSICKTGKFEIKELDK